ncbi:MAG: dimethyl sulfoxide reductase anchor subunit [Bacteroidales bacterium]|nr:dimethyl sulfoxide reductase anchor subunit [Bacteroidales bacterium]
MEIHWPLILFTTFMAWSAGLFGTQCIFALRNKANKAQMPALVVSVILLVIGGIAVFTHLQHWERIFNGFGNPSSGITQELVAVVLIVIAMIIFFIALRAREEDHRIARPAPIIGIVFSVVLAGVAGFSYLMPSRPTWDSPAEVLSILGNACILGPATFALIVAIVNNRKNKEAIQESSGFGSSSGYMFIGSIVNIVTTAVFFITMIVAASTSFTDVGRYFDPTHPTYAMSTTMQANPFGGDALIFSILTIVFVIATLVFAFLDWRAKKKPTIAFTTATLVCAVAGTVLLRLVFYIVGISLFMFY